MATKELKTAQDIIDHIDPFNPDNQPTGFVERRDGCQDIMVLIRAITEYEGAAGVFVRVFTGPDKNEFVCWPINVFTGSAAAAAVQSATIVGSMEYSFGGAVLEYVGKDVAVCVFTNTDDKTMTVARTFLAVTRPHTGRLQVLYNGDEWYEAKKAADKFGA